MLPIVVTSLDQGAPVVNNVPGSLCDAIYAVCVTGFNNLSIVSVSISSNIATIKTAATHGLKPKQRMTITGVAISAANGDKLILNTPTTDTFTFECKTPDASENPLSASCKRTPLGWIRAFSGTGKAIFKMTDPASYGQMLRVDETTAGGATAIDARVIMVESATGVDNYTDPSPTPAQNIKGGYWSKGMDNATPKFWAIIGDGRFFYYIVEDSARLRDHSISNYGFTGGCFGDAISIKPGESYGGILCACYTQTSSNSEFPFIFNTQIGAQPDQNKAFFISRQHNGIAKSIVIGASHPFVNGDKLSQNSSLLFPSPIGNELAFAEPSFIVETLPAFANPIRGIMPGLVSILCRWQDLPDSLTGMQMRATDGSDLEVIIFKRGSTGRYNDSAFGLKLSSAWR